MNKNYRTEKRKLFKIQTKLLNDIYNSAKEICNEWDRKTIPLNLLHTIINKATPTTEQRSKESGLDDYAKCLEGLELDLNKIAKNMDSKSVPLSELLKGLKIIKNAFMRQYNKLEDYETDI